MYIEDTPTVSWRHVVNFYISFMLSDCGMNESCGFVAISAAGSEALCDLHSAVETNFNCTASGLVNNDAHFKGTALTIIVRDPIQAECQGVS